MSQNPEMTRRTGWICLVLALATLCAYWNVFSAGFVEYDDPYYVVQNAHVQNGFDSESLRWAFTTKDCGNWHPLTWLSHILDCSLYGLNPTGHHATNLIIHILNSILLFLLLQRMTGAQWRSAFVATLFALHPLHVESVAWVAERKDVLSTLFWMLTIWAYIGYAEQPGLVRYLLVFFLFVLGLLSKPMVVTLPFLLLLLDFWPLYRFPDTVKLFGKYRQIYASSVERRCRVAPPGRLLLEKVPLMVLSFGSSLVTTWAQEEGILTALDLKYRLLNAGLSYLRYIVKMFWPARLYVNYPYPHGWPIWLPVLAILIITGISLVAVRQASGRPWFFVGWFWYLGTLVPVIGLVQVGIQSMADRYTYVPLIGLFIILAWGGYGMIHSWQNAPVLVFGPPATVLLVCALLTANQVGYWNNSVALFQHALNMEAANLTAEYNLGASYAKHGQLELASQHLENAIKISPEYGTSYNTLGLIQNLQGKYADAEESFRTALKFGGAAATSHYGLAVALEKQGKPEEAADECLAVLKLTPDLWDPHDEYGVILQLQGKLKEALDEFLLAIKLQPMVPLPHLHAGGVLRQVGRTSEAVQQYQQALKLDPELVEALNDLAWIRASSPDSALRNGAEAVRLAERACHLTHNEAPLLLGTLGAAYAAAGKFDAAAATAEMASTLAASQGKQQLAEKNQQLAELFRLHKAYFEMLP